MAAYAIGGDTRLIFRTVNKNRGRITPAPARVSAMSDCKLSGKHPLKGKEEDGQPGTCRQSDDPRHKDRFDHIAVESTNATGKPNAKHAAAQRIMQIDPDVRIIFATGYDQETISKSDMPSSDQIVLSKPYNIEELSQMIKGQLG